MFKPTWILVAAFLAGQSTVLSAPATSHANPSSGNGYGYPGSQQNQTPWGGNSGGQVNSPTEKEPEYDAQDGSYGTHHKAQPDSHQYPGASPSGSVSSAEGKPGHSTATPWRPGQVGSPSDGSTSPSWEPSPKSPYPDGQHGDGSAYVPWTGDESPYSGINNSTPPTTGWGGGAGGGNDGTIDSPRSKNDTGYPNGTISSPQYNSSYPGNGTTNGCRVNYGNGTYPDNSTVWDSGNDSTPYNSTNSTQTYPDSDSCQAPDNSTTIPPGSGTYPTPDNSTTASPSSGSYPPVDNSTTSPPSSGSGYPTTGSGTYPTPDNSTTTPPSSGGYPPVDNSTTTPPSSGSGYPTPDNGTISSPGSHSDDDTSPCNDGIHSSTGWGTGSGSSDDDDSDTQTPANGTVSSSTSKPPRDSDSSYSPKKDPSGSVSSATGHKKPGDPYSNSGY